MKKTKSLDGICYEKPFLKDVILRLDFATAIPAINEKIPAKLTKIVTRRFPISEPQVVHSQQIQPQDSGISIQSSQETNHNFYGKNREKTYL